LSKCFTFKTSTFICVPVIVFAFISIPPSTGASTTEKVSVSGSDSVPKVFNEVTLAT